MIYILLFAGFFSQLPSELEESAIMDGATFPRVFGQIMLPLAMPVVVAFSLASARPGRTWGVDALLARRYPGWRLG